MKNVRVAVDGAIGRITLARPEKKNALDRVTAEELADSLFALSEAPVRVVAIDGDGADFCAGADIAALEKRAAYATDLLSQFWLVHRHATKAKALQKKSCDPKLPDFKARCSPPSAEVA